MNGPTPLLSTCQALASHARQRPDALAISNGQSTCTYRGLATHVVQILDALAGIGISRGQIIGVETTDRYLHLLLLLACEALGATTMSLLPFELAPPLNPGRLCDRILASEATPEPAAGKTFVMTRDWLVKTFTATVGDHRLEALEVTPDPDGLVRLIKSSGTTGRPKVMGMTFRVQQRTLRNNLLYAADHIGAHPGYLCLYHFSIRGCHTRAWLTLQLGGTIHFAALETARNVIATGSITYALLLTGDLEKLVGLAGHGPVNIHIDVIGAAVSPRLRRDAERTLSKRLLVSYGTNEVHHVAVVDANMVGVLFPHVRVMIVDPAGNPLPFGETGLIRIQSDTMATGYLDAPEQTAAAFVGGWYQTNDLGHQPSPTELVVSGRTDDMLNVGGLKIPPGPVIEQLKAIDGILDATIATVRDASGCEVLLVAVETGLDDGASDLGPLVSPIIRHYASIYQLLPLRVFPRTETGKIRREGIEEAYRRTLPGH